MITKNQIYSSKTTLSLMFVAPPRHKPNGSDIDSMTADAMHTIRQRTEQLINANNPEEKFKMNTRGDAIPSTKSNARSQLNARFNARSQSNVSSNQRLFQTNVSSTAHSKPTTQSAPKCRTQKQQTDIIAASELKFEAFDGIALRLSIHASVRDTMKMRYALDIDNIVVVLQLSSSRRVRGLTTE